MTATINIKSTRDRGSKYKPSTLVTGMGGETDMGTSWLEWCYRPTSQSWTHRASYTASKSTIQSANQQRAKQTTNQPTSQQAKKPDSQPTNQPVNQQINKSINTVNQQINKSINLPCFINCFQDTQHKYLQDIDAQVKNISCRFRYNSTSYC